MNAIVDPMRTPALVAPERLRPLKRREYERLVELGVFGDERIELLRGALVEMSPQGEPHTGLGVVRDEVLAGDLGALRDPGAQPVRRERGLDARARCLDLVSSR